MKELVEQIKLQRLWLINELNKILKVVFAVYPSDANFLMVKVIDIIKFINF